MSRSSRAGVATAVLAAATLAGCTSTASTGDPAGSGPIAVRASDSGCDVATPQAGAGTITFAVNNTGTKTTEFYFYGAGDRIMGEVENIGPGLTRQMIVEVSDGGTYTTSCKPGMLGDGIRAPFIVTGTAARSVDEDSKLAEATAGYRRYVASQIEALVPTTQQFVDTVKAGDVDGAKALYPLSRAYWERIEPVAESFGDIDPKIDGREDDEREPGVAFTGYHRLEKDLWDTGLQPDTGAVADQLMVDINDLASRTGGIELAPAQLAGGAKELLDEVATKKITGEEDRYSHTDLYDFQANIEGSQAAVAALRPVIDENDATLGPALDENFAAVQGLLDGYRVGDGFRLYTELSPEDVKKMAEAVDALGEPVSQVAGAVTS